MTAARAMPCLGCGCESCKISGDDFNRTNSTNIGSVLNEITGDASVSSNRLLMPATGVVESEADGPAPAGTDGHKAEWIIQFGNVIGPTKFIRVHVDVVDDNNSHCAEIKPVIPGGSIPNKFTIEIFNKTSGALISLAGPIDCEDINGNIANDQSVCVSIDGNKIVAVINTIRLVEEEITPHGGTKTRLETINTSNLKGDDFVFSKISVDPDPDCPHCTGEDPGPECEVCENSDEEQPTKALPTLKLIFAGLTNKFTDIYAYQHDPGNGILGTGDDAPDGNDDFVYDLAALDGTVIVPYAACLGAVGSVDEITCAGGAKFDGALLYGSQTAALNFVQEGLTFVSGQRPLDTGNGWGQNGSIWDEPPDVIGHVATHAIMLAASIWLARKHGGGFKIYAKVKVLTQGLYIKSVAGSGETFGPPWLYIGSGVGALGGGAVFEGDWDGDCLALTDTALTFVEECSSPEVDWSGVTITVGPSA